MGEALVSLLEARGVGVQLHGGLLHVDVTDDSAYDVVRDAVAELGLGLVRMERQRHRMTEIFSSPEGSAAHV